MQLEPWGGDYRLSELMSLLVGDKIGEGKYRRVYDCRLDPTLVVKVDRSGEVPEANQTEWCLWQNTPEKIRRRWLLPCVLLSRGGTILLQRKGTQLHAADYADTKIVPPKIPRILNQDAHVNNFSLYKGKALCHDYAMLTFDNAKPWELVKRKW